MAKIFFLHKASKNDAFRKKKGLYSTDLIYRTSITPQKAANYYQK
jgi:hypothetical protein